MVGEGEAYVVDGEGKTSCGRANWVTGTEIPQGLLSISLGLVMREFRGRHRISRRPRGCTAPAAFVPEEFDGRRAGLI